MMKDICMLWTEPSTDALFSGKTSVTREDLIKTIGERSRQAQIALTDILLSKWNKGESFDEEEIAKLLSDCGFDVEKTTVSFDIYSLKYQLPLFRSFHWFWNV